MHINTAIRRYLETLYKTTATAGSNVYIWPRMPQSPGDLPAIIISTGDAVAHQEQTIGDSQTRILQNVTQIVAEASNPEDFDPETDQEADVQDEIDQVELECEQALHIDQTFGGLIEGLQFATAETELSAEGDAKTGRRALTHLFTITVDRRNPEV